MKNHWSRSPGGRSCDSSLLDSVLAHNTATVMDRLRIKWKSPPGLRPETLKPERLPLGPHFYPDLTSDTDTNLLLHTVDIDVHRVPSTHAQMDYNLDNMGPKHGKALPCQEDRLDSGLDSLKEDELVSDFEILDMNAPERAQRDYEPWRSAVTEDGDTPLHLSIIHEATDYALQMIKLSHNHPFLNLQNHQRQTALHLAVITEQPQLVEKLLKAGCDPRLTDNCGNTALHIACKRGSLTCFSVITQTCQRHLTSIMSFPNYSGHNCLHLASINGYISLVENLVKLGADINAQEQCSGRTALHLAVDLQNSTLVRCLLDLGANVNCMNYGGFTAYHLTYGRQSEEIRCQLFEKTAQELRELPESESDDSDMEDLDLSEDELYDDIKFGK
ncbi:NF-kappa-B inhibitor alpha-like [Solea senegalensis]|uniref:NF-kappa-B inhibitor alpha n=1 Tax=Solea senegalensis TaxID=28829 RepID=A0AAV6RWB2_SOLSE|nr:NF-kappa-B inhibitor alpha-like [Solea senegalensis]